MTPFVRRLSSRASFASAVAITLFLACTSALAKDVPRAPIEQLAQGAVGMGQADYSSALRILIALTALTVVPALIVSATSFSRIIIVLSMLRHAFGMQETPPNVVLISLALFLTAFTMSPVIAPMYSDAIAPFLEGKTAPDKAWETGAKPLRAFLIRQTRESDLALILEIAKTPKPKSVEEVSLVHLVPAFMLSELRTGFQIGFVIFLPFLLIDLIVASTLMSLGMMMVPPSSIALPLKVLMFVLIDGWVLVVRALVGTIA